MDSMCRMNWNPGCEFSVHDGGMDDPDQWIGFELENPGPICELSFRYAAGDPRPVDVKVNGDVQLTGVATQVTGSFGP